jgi:uncharacterized protein YcaQ
LDISKNQAQHIVIESQGLNQSATSLAVINRLGYVQIDTLSVAERAHHHVFHSRNPNYTKIDLDNMMAKSQIFEYWSHAAAYLPISDFRFSLVKKASFTSEGKHWFAKDEKMNQYVLDRISAEGPLQSKDFKDARDTPGLWYDYKPAKIALEQLFMEGKLMIKERVTFQKVYDLTERVLPSNTEVNTPTASEFCAYLIKTTLQSQGVATLSEMGYLRKGIKPVLFKVINQLVDSNELIKLKIEGLDQPYYAMPAMDFKTPADEVHILSPFDNLVIQRKRLSALFDFDYQIECYVPEAKRKYGYYCLPVLYRDQFVARFDPKADRKVGIFTLKKIWFESGFIPDDAFYTKFSAKIKQFATFCGCDTIVIEKCAPSSFKKALKGFIKQAH